MNGSGGRQDGAADELCLCYLAAVRFSQLHSSRRSFLS
jgi:hypothetical protein